MVRKALYIPRSVSRADLKWNPALTEYTTRMHAAKIKQLHSMGRHDQLSEVEREMFAMVFSDHDLVQTIQYYHEMQELPEVIELDRKPQV